MEESRRINLWDKIIKFFYVLMGVTFLPVLFCVFFLDKRIKYHDDWRPVTIRPNSMLFVIALLGALVLCMLIRLIKEIEITKKINIITDVILASLFVILYFVNVWIAREISFKLPWDVMMVNTHASYLAEGNTLGYNVYFSIYTNNIPITYFLKKMFVKVMEMADYPYVNDFIWIQVNCALISLGGFFSCLTVKKLMRKLMPTAVCFLLYVAVFGLSPWKMAPYTDTYSMAFTIICIYFYFCYRKTRRELSKYLFMALSLFAAVAGGLIKPSVYILIIAILVVECIRLLREYKQNWKYVLFEIVLIVVLFWAKGIYRDHMMEDLGLDFNEEIEASWQHYFRMGQNEETSGAYNPGDAGLFGEFQESKKERNEAALERALARVKEKGFVGNIYFWLGKMTMVFNEGTFGWANEVDIWGTYPASLARNDRVTEILRQIFWPEMRYTGAYNTVCQLIWIFCLIGISGFCFLTEEKRENCVVMAVGFLGLFFYQMLFEARARYLIAFLPVLTVISICGFWQYAEWAGKLIENKKAEVKPWAALLQKIRQLRKKTVE